MREERKVVDESTDETPRLEELSDEDLELVAGGGQPNNPGKGAFTAYEGSDGRSRNPHFL